MLVTVVVFIMIIEMPNKQQRVQDNQNIKKRALLIASVDKKKTDPCHRIDGICYIMYARINLDCQPERGCL